MQRPFSIHELSLFLGVSKRTAAQLVADGTVHSVHVGRLVRIPAEAVAELLGVEHIDREAERPLLTMAEVSTLGGWTAPTTYSLLRSGRLASVMVGGRRMITTASLTELLSARVVAS